MCVGGGTDHALDVGHEDENSNTIANAAGGSALASTCTTTKPEGPTVDSPAHSNKPEALQVTASDLISSN